MGVLQNGCAAVLAVAILNCSAAQITAPRALTVAPSAPPSDTPATGSSMPVLSGDGRYLAFISRSPNLLTNATGANYQVFVRDLANSNLVLVSATAGNVGGNDYSVMPSISSNGLWIAFESQASDLVPGDTNELSDVFLRDLAGAQTILVSSARNGAARNPMISSDGRYVAFESRASDLTAGDTNAAQDVFVRDLGSNTINLVSINLDGTAPAGRGSELLTMTPDGRYVAFWSEASDISLESTNIAGQVYVRDMQAGVTYCLTENIVVFTHGVRRFKTVLTPDGRFAALQELYFPGGAPGGRVFHTQAFGASVSEVRTQWGRPGPGLAISDDGQKVVFRDAYGLNLREMSSTTNRLLVRDTFDTSGFIQLNIEMFQVARDFQHLWYTLMATNHGYQLFKYDFANDQINLVSTNALGLPINAPVASPFAISESGLVAAYETAASDVGPIDANRAPDIFVVNSGLAVSRTPAMPPETTAGSAILRRGSISANGQRIAFVGTDGSLVANDTNQHFDLFVADLNSNAVLNVHGTLRTNSAMSPVLSADGSALLFQRIRGELSGQGVVELYRADLHTGLIQQVGPGFFQNPAETLLSQDGRWLVTGGPRIWLTDFRTPAIPGQASNQVVDLAYHGQFAGNGPSSNPSISLDGEWVVFLSRARDLIHPAEDGGLQSSYTSGVSQVFARNLRQRKTRLVSVTDSGYPIVAGATNPVLSANSRFVLFESTGNVYRYDLHARGRVTNNIVCSGCSQPSVNGDGHLVAYTQQGPLFVTDVRTGAIEYLGARGSDPIIGYDGRFVAYVGKQTGTAQVYLRDRWKATTHLISRNHFDFGPGNGHSGVPVMSHDGRTIAFQSFASDLVPGDYNATRDIFVVRIESVDADGDGLDDDWEQFYFGTLARDGTENQDNDHLSDAEEFLAGTNPVDPASALRLTGISSRIVSGPLQDTQLRWISTPGKTYRVQHKLDLDSPWSELPGDIITGGLNGSAAHLDSAQAGPFYRIRLVQ